MKTECGDNVHTPLDNIIYNHGDFSIWEEPKPKYPKKITKGTTIPLEGLESLEIKDGKVSFVIMKEVNYDTK